MKRVYLDTNLILSPLRMQDPNFSLMEKIRAQPHLEFVTSMLTIAEIFNIILRDHEIFRNAMIKLPRIKEIEKINQFSFNLQIIIIIEYLLQYYKTTLIDDNQPEPVSIENRSRMINPIFKLIFQFNFNPKLKTLDLIHYCYAKYFTNYRDLQIDYLVTSDLTFQSARGNLKNDSTILILSPETLIDIES